MKRFRLGYATPKNYTKAYWFTDAKMCYEVKTGIYSGVLNFLPEAQSWNIYIKLGNKPYKEITLEQLKTYI